YPEFKSILVFAVFTNFLADYLSLLESRFMLNILMKHYSKTKVIVILFLDTLATVILWIIPAMLALFVITILFHHDVKISHLYDFMQSLIPTTFELVHMVIGLEDDKNPIFLRILLCSSFFTSVWLWLYLIGGGVIKLWSSFNKGRITLFSKLNIANYPVTSIGFVVCLVITIGFILGAPFALR
ncbi:MAG: hypothetical protein KAJ62_05155, partial [Desulfobacteraceae bacterium]|nr:hypothetical protein [Desulfobacteraceae bacterium]